MTARVRFEMIEAPDRDEAVATAKAWAKAAGLTLRTMGGVRRLARPPSTRTRVLWDVELVVRDPAGWTWERLPE